MRRGRLLPAQGAILIPVVQYDMIRQKEFKKHGV